MYIYFTYWCVNGRLDSGLINLISYDIIPIIHVINWGRFYLGNLQICTPFMRLSTRTKLYPWLKCSNFFPIFCSENFIRNFYETLLLVTRDSLLFTVTIRSRIHLLASYFGILMMTSFLSRISLKSKNVFF